MIQTLNALLAPALMERLTLVVNHVLSSEPQAMARLLPHRGRLLRLELQGWPALLPPPPVLAFRVTPAGLVEWCPGDDLTPELRVKVNAANPAALALDVVAGRQPPVDIEGDAQLATDVDWLLKNLRWDVAADPTRRAASGCARRWSAWGRSSSSSARCCPRGATCCRRTSPTNWPGCRTGCRRFPRPRRCATIERAFGRRIGEVFASSTPSRWPARPSPRCTSPRCCKGREVAVKVLRPGMLR
jgi:ubiquinone biosynthesis protein UbiJ